jgi:(2Fe-2S) ferredoxin
MESPSILICQHRTCRKQGAAKVLVAFKAIDSTEVRIEGSGCLGQCGNGPNVLVLPDRIWHYRVRVEDVTDIIDRAGDALL